MGKGSYQLSDCSHVILAIKVGLYLGRSQSRSLILVERDWRNAIAWAVGVAQAPWKIFHIIKDINHMSKDTIAAFHHVPREN